MTHAHLVAQLALWRRRHDYRLRRLGAAHAANDAQRIRHWHYQLQLAGIQIRRLERRLHPAPPPISSARQRIVAAAYQAKANYDRNPGQWHYLAGGISNTVVMHPTPWNWRSDCSQWVVNVYREAGVPCPGSGSYMYSNTISIASGGGGVITYNPKPGDLGLYGPRWATHHVELVTGTNPLTFCGHGNQRVDTLTPGLPSFFLTFEQLNR